MRSICLLPHQRMHCWCRAGPSARGHSGRPAVHRPGRGAARRLHCFGWGSEGGEIACTVHMDDHHMTGPFCGGRGHIDRATRCAPEPALCTCPSCPPLLPLLLLFRLMLLLHLSKSIATAGRRTTVARILCRGPCSLRCWFSSDSLLSKPLCSALSQSLRTRPTSWPSSLSCGSHATNGSPAFSRQFYSCVVISCSPAHRGDGPQR